MLDTGCSIRPRPPGLEAWGLSGRRPIANCPQIPPLVRSALSVGMTYWRTSVVLKGWSVEEGVIPSPLRRGSGGVLWEEQGIGLILW